MQQQAPGKLLRVARPAARVALLVTTGWLLVATSAPPRKQGYHCSVLGPPVTFSVRGTCGPEGLIVVWAHGRLGEVWVENAALLGLPPARRSPAATWEWANPGDGHGVYLDERCPYELERGGWRVYGREQHLHPWLGDGGAGGASGGDAGVGSDTGTEGDAGLGSDAGAEGDADLGSDTGGDALGDVQASRGAPSPDATYDRISPYPDRPRWNIQDACLAVLRGGELVLQCSHEGRPTCEAVLTPVP